MKKVLLIVLATTLLLQVGVCRAADQPLPDTLKTLETLQRRADKLAYRGLGSDNYYLAKARAWMDMALSEYHENENTGLIPAAIAQAQTLLDALERKQGNISMDTPQQLPGSVAVRPDLWNKIDAMKKQQQFSCGQVFIAEAEIQLVWAGHEKQETSWEHAQGYARNAAGLVKEAQSAIGRCTAQSPAPPAPILEKLTMSSDTLFEFGSPELVTSALWRLNKLADNLKAMHTLDTVELIGHTDRLRSDGHPERNQLLSAQRAENIKEYLVGKGIPAEKIRVTGMGSSQPLVTCPTNTSKQEQVECLQPNRRVEIVLHGSK